MTKSKDDLSNVEFAGKVKTQTFKQFQLERLIKNGIVIPASKLAESKVLELQRSLDFEAASIDEYCHRKTAAIAPSNKLDNLPLTRERFEE
jgi:nitrogenase molybdenum-iron protein alpha/beta subunit